MSAEENTAEFKTIQKRFRKYSQIWGFPTESNRWEGQHFVENESKGLT